MSHSHPLLKFLLLFSLLTLSPATAEEIKVIKKIRLSFSNSKSFNNYVKQANLNSPTFDGIINYQRKNLEANINLKHNNGLGMNWDNSYIQYKYNNKYKYKNMNINITLNI